MANRAQIVRHHAFLFTNFGRETAVRWFGQETIDSLPRFTRGRHKGLPKAVLCWAKVERGGWVGNGADDFGPRGYVENRVGKTIDRSLHELAPYGDDPCSGKIVAIAPDRRTA